jgi:hypothetical protein
MSEAEELWRARSDDEVLAASKALFEYTEAGEALIRQNRLSWNGRTTSLAGATDRRYTPEVARARCTVFRVAEGPGPTTPQQPGCKSRWCSFPPHASGEKYETPMSQSLPSN